MSVRSSRRWAALPAAALLTLGVTSCSGDAPEPEEAAESTAAPATPAAKSPSRAALRPVR